MKNLTIAVLLSVFALSATAYEGPRGGQKMQKQNSEMHMEKLTKRLDLTAQQQEQIKALQAQAQEKRNALDTQYNIRSEEHTSELQSRPHLVCRLLLEK